MSNDQKVFADGFIFKRRDNAPDFVIGSISVKVEEAIKFLEDNVDNGWVNLNVKRSQSGKAYIELDTWKPNQQSGNAPSKGADAPF